MTNNYDIFISFRRDSGFETAKHLNDLLVHDGYTAIFDIDTLREGDFNEMLFRINQCVNFILVIDKQLAYILKPKKNIISLYLSDVDRFPGKLPKDIADVATKNGSEHDKYYFYEFYWLLKSFLNCIPRNAKLDDKDCATATFYSDSDVSISFDSEYIANVKAKEFTNTQISNFIHLKSFCEFKYVFKI